MNKRLLDICVFLFLLVMGSLLQLHGQTQSAAGRMREIVVSPRRIIGFTGALQAGMLVDVWIPSGPTLRGVQVISSKIKDGITPTGDVPHTTVLLLNPRQARAVERASSVELVVASTPARAGVREGTTLSGAGSESPGSRHGDGLDTNTASASRSAEAIVPDRTYVPSSTAPRSRILSTVVCASIGFLAIISFDRALRVSRRRRYLRRQRETSGRANSAVRSS